MNRKPLTSRLLLVTCAILFVSQPAHASKESFAQRMQSIVAGSEKGNEQIGIKIVSLNNGDILFAHKGDTLLNPASCTKVVTTAAALKLLGPDYRFHTKYFTDLRPTGGKVGKMWVVGYGDPSIVIERLWRIARDIANTGLKRIEGDIIIDDYYFDGYKYPGYTDQSGRAYNSLAGAVSLNFNTVTIVVSPASRVGVPPHVAPDTAGPYFRVVNTAKTGPRGSKKTVSVVRTQQNGEDVLVVSGSVPVESPPDYIYRNITDPTLYFGLALKSLLEQNGVSVGGRIMRGNFPGGAYLLVDSISKPLALIIRDMNKFSNNFIAEQMVKTMAAEIGSVPGTTAKGIRVIENYLSHLGIQPGSYTMVNGSGLTRDNKISATTLITVLAHMYADFHIAPEALSSFSIAGVDGTIRDRHKGEGIRGLARAKTGSLYGVSTLVGTIPSASGEMLGYSILMNGDGLGWEESHKVQESMLNAMAVFTR